MNAKVFFSKHVDPETVLKLYNVLGEKLEGNIAIKLHSGELGNQNFLRPLFWRPIIDQVGGTVVECNTAYPGERNTTEKHLKTIEQHGWQEYFSFDLMDAEGPDMELNIPHGKRIQKNYVGKNLSKYDSLLVLSHFKGHPMGGYGGALKQLAIGCASSYGKSYIHGAGTIQPFPPDVDNDHFLEAMADAASSITEFFSGRAIYINVMKNLSVDCDCVANAESPCMKDIGTLCSTDPIAIDQACIDLIYAASDDPGQKHFLERLEGKNGIHTIEAAAELGFGSRRYELINVD